MNFAADELQPQRDRDPEFLANRAVPRTAMPEMPGSSAGLSLRDLSNALSRHEMHLEYQPQIDLKTGAIVGFEALARWNHPYRGAISPAAFIPLLESWDIINDFTLQTVERALEDMRMWHDNTDVRLSINLSAAGIAPYEIDEIV